MAAFCLPLKGNEYHRELRESPELHGRETGKGTRFLVGKCTLCSCKGRGCKLQREVGGITVPVFLHSSEGYGDHDCIVPQGMGYPMQCWKGVMVPVGLYSTMGNRGSIRTAQWPVV